MLMLIKLIQPMNSGRNGLGVVYGGAIFLAWLGSLLGLLILPLSQIPLWGWGLAVLGRTFLQTGLFIVAHDAMHLSLFPRFPRINHSLGAIALGCYGFLSYRHCCRHHHSHHHQPAEAGDPDFHDGVHAHPIRWYLRFMTAYVSRTRLGMIVGLWVGILVGLVYGCHLSPLSVLGFWVLPLVLSSLQLFVFGTYLPHRQPRRPALLAQWCDRHHAVSSPYPRLWLFLTCYHLGCHWEHHEYPQVPWYQLPAMRQAGVARGANLIPNRFESKLSNQNP